MKRVAAAFVALLIGVGVVTCRLPEPPVSAHTPILGLHLVLGCVDCHPSDQAMDETPTACEGCHEADRPADHDPGTCAACHSEDGWQFAVRDHELPLDGGHANVTCFGCHDDGEDFTTLDGACSSCHERPAQHAAGPCEQCHQVTTWGDVDFNHNDFFPIPHEGVGQCTSCHLGGDYQTFSCIDCHEHAKGPMDKEHKGENGYEWASFACLDCHPDGDE
jgi:hypothetical protein